MGRKLKFSRSTNLKLLPRACAIRSIALIILLLEKEEIKRLSAIGLGGHHIGRLREEQDSIKLSRSAIDRGINFMDNSWDYHKTSSQFDSTAMNPSWLG